MLQKDYYLKHILPLEQQLNELNREAAKLLFTYFKNKKFLSKKERHNLGGVIARHLHIIFEFENREPDDELKEIFKAVQGISYEEAVESDFENLKDEMKSMFDDFDIDMNFDDIHYNMTEEEKAEVIAILAIDVQRCLQLYKEELLWLVHGNHKRSPRPTVEETKQQMKQLKEKIISHLTDIETKTK